MKTEKIKPAYLYEKMEEHKVRCYLCSHKCVLKNRSRGICGVRENRDGILVSLVYERIIARHVDPIEKKPLFHFLPGSRSYSIATMGCNLRCLFCQNSEISQMPTDHGEIWGERMAPSEIVDEAKAAETSTIAYTYTEPTIYFELAIDTARLAIKKGIRNVFITNGYMTEDCLNEIYPDLHGANVDLKSFRDEFYKKQCGARLEPVLHTLETIKKMGIWLEITTLLIPGLNDSKEELKDIAEFIAGLDSSIPWHISRFHPTYQLKNRPSTPPESIRSARDIGYKAGLKYVYTGNLPGDDGENTFCHGCKSLLINRLGFSIRDNRITKACCPRCSTEIPGVWE